MQSKFQKTKILILICVSLFVIFLIFFATEIAPKNYLKISFLDVGQGDSILFQTPHGGKILIDGGRDKKVLSELGKKLPVYNKNIELVIATHDDSDHITGLIDVLKKYNVQVLLYSLPNSKSILSQELMKVAKEKNTKVVQIAKPMIIKTSDGLVIKILFPVANMNGTESNDASIVSQFVFGQTKFLLTGDLPQTEIGRAHV